MKLGEIQKTLSGDLLYIWQTFSSSMLSPQRAKEIVESFPFPEGHLVGDKVWRMKVETHLNGKILTIRATYQGIGFPLPNEVVASCERDARDVVLEPLAKVFEENEDPANAQGGSNPRPAPAPTPPQAGGGRTGGGQGGGQRGGGDRGGQRGDRGGGT